MCLAQGPQRSEAGEARTRGLSISSQALYYCAPYPYLVAQCKIDDTYNNRIGRVPLLMGMDRNGPP